MLGFEWTYTQREVCVRLWVDLYTEGSLCYILGGLIQRGKFVLSLGWAYSIHRGKFVLGFVRGGYACICANIIGVKECTVESQSQQL